MNDRFKFRVWKKAENKMVEGVTYLNPLLLDEEIAPDEAKNYIIMQCTGFKDKNGELIYEGDVVKFEEIYECACFTDIKVVLFKIVWSECSFFAKQIKIIQGNVSYEFPLTLSDLFEKELYAEHQTIINVEIIGNIYEDSHLIENSNNLC